MVGSVSLEYILMVELGLLKLVGDYLSDVHPNRTNEIPRTDPSVQVDYARVVDLDIGASKSDICAIRVVTISERAGRTRARNRGLV
jgi:hypothetical protein